MFSSQPSPSGGPGFIRWAWSEGAAVRRAEAVCCREEGGVAGRGAAGDPDHGRTPAALLQHQVGARGVKVCLSLRLERRSKKRPVLLKTPALGRSFPVSSDFLASWRRRFLSIGLLVRRFVFFKQENLKTFSSVCFFPWLDQNKWTRLDVLYVFCILMLAQLPSFLKLGKSLNPKVDPSGRECFFYLRRQHFLPANG